MSTRIAVGRVGAELFGMVWIRKLDPVEPQWWTKRPTLVKNNPNWVKYQRFCPGRSCCCNTWVYVDYYVDGILLPW